MTVQPDAHPADVLLQRFALGMLDDAEAADVISHLESCPTCRKRAASLPDDSFVSKVRTARSVDQTSLPGESPRPNRPGSRPPAPASRRAAVAPGLAGLKGYEVIRELGRGGMGVVYLARNTLMDRLEVLKVINKARVGQPDAVERFVQEIRSAARLNHPNVALAYSAHQLDGLLVLAMEHVDGNDLSRTIRDRGAFPVAYACYCAHQAALALQHGHEAGLVHRDIKPSNILLSKKAKRPVVKIIDFGLAKAKSEVPHERELTGVDQVMGTAGYMAPEQALDARNADTRADIYGLGCTLYCLLAGEPPFQGQTAHAVMMAQVGEDCRPLRELRPEVLPELAAVVARMMAKDPDDRFREPREVADALVPFIRQSTPSSAGEITLPDAGADDARAQPHRRPPWFHGDLRAGLSRNRNAVAVALVLGALLLSGLVFVGAVVVRARLAEGTVVVDNVPADAEILVDDRAVTVRRNGDTASVTMTSAGTHRLKVRHGDYEILTADVIVTVGGAPVRLRAERAAPRNPPVAETANGPEPAPPEARPTALDPAAARELLGQRLHGKPRFEGGVLTLEYDFQDPEQLKDFDASDATPEVSGGRLRLAFGDVLRHVASFKTLALKTTIGMRNRGRTHLRTTGGASISTLDSNAWHADLNFRGTRLLRGEFDADYAHPSDGNRMVPVEYWSNGKETGFRFGKVRERTAAEAVAPGRVELLGGDGGNQFGVLTLSGEPEPHWLARFLDPAAPPSPLPSGPPPKAPAAAGAIDLDRLQRKFAVPVTWADGILTLHYDFAAADQMRDFRAGTERGELRGGGLLLRKGQSVEHRVQFRTVTVSGDIAMSTPAGGPIKTTGGFEVKGENFQAWFVALLLPDGERPRTLYAPPKPPAGLPFELTISSRRAGLRWGATVVGSGGLAMPAGHVIFAGGDGVNRFARLTLCGEPDPDWLRAFVDGGE